MRAPLSVLHLAKVGGIAGSENHLLDLIPRLSKMGIRVTMGVLKGPGDSPGEFVRALHAREIPCVEIPLGGDCDIFGVMKVRRLIREGGFDLVHTHLIHGDVYGVIGGVGTRIPIISSRHNDDPHWREGVRGLVVRLLLRRVNRFIAISNFLASWCVECGIGTPERFSVIHYGLALEEGEATPDRGWRKEWGVAEGIPLVGMVARLCEQKGHTTLIRAFREVHRRLPVARLVLIGDGPLRGTLEREVEREGLGGVVHFAGALPDARRVMPVFDLFVHPSRWEGFGLVFLEAMAASLPVVATKVSAIPEIVVSGETGILVPPEDSSALAEAIIILLSDPKGSEAMGEAGRARVVSSFSAQECARRTAEVYGEVCGCLPSGDAPKKSPTATPAATPET